MVIAPENKCDHGVTFDEKEAARILSGIVTISSGRADIDFIMGNPSATQIIRRKWPRLMGPCPKGCGFNGIAYASFAHYVAGDW